MKKMISGIALSLFIGTTAFTSQQPAQAAGAGAKANEVLPLADAGSGYKDKEIEAIFEKEWDEWGVDFKDPIGLLLEHADHKPGEWKPDKMHWLFIAMLLNSEEKRTWLASEQSKALKEPDDVVAKKAEAYEWAFLKSDEWRNIAKELALTAKKQEEERNIAAAAIVKKS